MHSSVKRVCSIAAILVLGLGFTSSASAAGPTTANGRSWQIGDIIVCFGSTGNVGGTCNVMRNTSTGLVLLDQISDTLLGATGGVAINNTLHLLVTDNGTGNSGSNVVMYSIASVDPVSGTAIAHTPLQTFNGSGGSGSNARAIAINSAGHMFVGNAGNNSPSIVELNANGTSTGHVFNFPSSGVCATTTLGSLDINANGDAIYVTAKDGVIRKVALPLSLSSSCTQFANFGSGVTLYGIKDIPSGALNGNCPAGGCPSRESILVVATGFTDPDAGEPAETGPDADAVNICTNAADQTPVSCALLLDTNPNPGLTAPLWQAGQQYFTLGATILDPVLHLQSVATAGTSGTQEPTFNGAGGTVIDNAVIWTDKGQPGWIQDTPYAHTSFPGTYIVDSNLNLQTVTTTGTSSHSQPTFNNSGTTIDGLQWSDQGAWQANHLFAVGSAVGDASGHPHTVLTAGTSGSGALPAGGWNGGGTTIDNAVTWTNQGLVVPYTGNHAFPLSTLIVVGGHAQQAVEPGTSGGSTPNFSITGGKTIDNAVTWTDQGQEFWHPSFTFTQGAVIVDPAGHVQQVTTAGISGTTQPTFNDSGSTASDGPDTLVWTDRGVLTWAANFNYDGTTAATTYVVDAANHVQKATTAGISGPATPVFNDGGTTQDSGVVWTDQGQKFWYPNFVFASNAIVVDAAGHVQQVTTPGTSAPTQPTFNDSGSTVTDGLQWADQGVAGSWAANNPYALNTIILDGANHIQKVTTAGTSGASQPAFNDSGSTTAEGPHTLVWTDLGPLGGSWAGSTPYALNALITDTNNHVEQATSAGASGGSAPTFSTSGGTVSDNAVVWSDQGLLAGNTTFTWQSGNPYTSNAQIIDPNNHVQKVTTVGTSGGSAPAFNDGGQVIDGLVWTDLGPTGTWAASTSFSAGTLFVDPGSFLQQVTTAGISTTPSQPSWNDTFPGGTTVDGLQWTDQGHSIWVAGHLYSTLGALISDAATHAQKVIETGTSGASTPGFSVVGGTTIDNAVIWTESHPSWLLNHSYVTGISDTLILDSNHHVQLVSNPGISGPSVPPFTSGHPVAGQTIDGLQWINQASPATSVLARYVVPNKSTLQALALDPFVTDCTGNGCAVNYAAARLVGNFWLGDSVSASLYKFSFASGGPTPFNTNLACTGCSGVTSIQSIGIYGGESANQPGLAKLLIPTSVTPNNASPTVASAPTENFLGNSETVTLYGLTASVKLALYASLVDPTSCFNDQPAHLSCRVTTSVGQPIVWKIDVPQGTTDLSAFTNASIATKYLANVGIDNGTDAFTDMLYDTTVLVGNVDPGQFTKPSVQSLHEVPFTANGGAACTFSSPVANTCYKSNRGTLNFTIPQCQGMSFADFKALGLASPAGGLSLVETFPPPAPAQAPLAINLTGASGGATNRKGSFRYDSSSNSWVYQLSVTTLNGATGTFTGCAFDSTHKAQTFCVRSFKIQKSCP